MKCLTHREWAATQAPPAAEHEMWPPRGAEPSCPSPDPSNTLARRYGPRTIGDMERVWSGVARAKPARPSVG